MLDDLRGYVGEHISPYTPRSFCESPESAPLILWNACHLSLFINSSQELGDES
jgi:hypothetical protein